MSRVELIAQADLKVGLYDPISRRTYDQPSYVEADLQVRLYGHAGCSSPRMPFKPAPRLKAFDYKGSYRYFLTICTRDRRCDFKSGDAVDRICAHLRRTADAEGFAVIAYCFMPDHLHALVEGTRDTADFTKLVKTFKQRSSYDWKRLAGVELWQRGYYERVLRADEDTITVARYVLSNPVRASLVRIPEEYPFLGSFTMDVRQLLESVST